MYTIKRISSNVPMMSFEDKREAESMLEKYNSIEPNYYLDDVDTHYYNDDVIGSINDVIETLKNIKYALYAGKYNDCKTLQLDLDYTIDDILFIISELKKDAR